MYSNELKIFEENMMIEEYVDNIFEISEELGAEEITVYDSNDNIIYQESVSNSIGSSTRKIFQKKIFKRILY